MKKYYQKLLQCINNRNWWIGRFSTFSVSIVSIIVVLNQNFHLYLIINFLTVLKE